MTTLTFGELLRQLMDERGVGVRALARQVPCDAGHISKLRGGTKGVSEAMAARLDELLGAGGRLVVLARATPAAPGHAGSVDGDPAGETDEDEMQRRRLLAALATLGAASSPAVEALQSIRDGVDRTVGRDVSSHLGEWEETVAEYGYSYLIHPPHVLVRDLAADLVAVQRVAGHAPGRARPSWQRIIGGLAALMAKTLCNLGQSPRAAREWWATAQHAADASGDRDLSLWVRGEQLVHGLYEGRPPVILLRKADRSVAGDGGMLRGMLHVRSVRAQLLAIEGAPGAAAAELAACEEIFGRLPSAITSEVRSVAGWAEDRLRYTEAWVHAHTGDRDRLDAAVARGLQVLPTSEPRIRVQLNLLRAAGHVRAGDTTEGVRHAHAAYEAQPAEHRTVMVRSLARQVVDAVPPPRRAEPVVTAYAELLASGGLIRSIT